MSARIGAALATAVWLFGTAALAQQPPPKKKPGKNDKPAATSAAPADTAAASASVSVTAPVVETPAPEVEATATATTTPTPAPAAPKSDDEWDQTEKDGQRYYFIGLRYRGYIIPQAFIGIFVDGGDTLWSNSIGLELDMRKDGFSLIPNITYGDYGSGDMLTHQKGKPQDVGDFSMVQSSLKAIWFGTDLLWSIKLHKMVDLEIGGGVQIGVIFGDLYDVWVQATTNPNVGFTLGGASGSSGVQGNGSNAGNAGTFYVPCQQGLLPGAKGNVTSMGAMTNTNPAGCNAGDHNNSTEYKVNNYTEPHGFNPIPPVFLNITIPYVGVRIKPIKSAEARIGMGFNLPFGVMFGISGDYGLEKLVEKK